MVVGREMEKEGRSNVITLILKNTRRRGATGDESRGAFELGSSLGGLLAGFKKRGRRSEETFSQQRGHCTLHNLARGSGVEVKEIGIQGEEQKFTVSLQEEALGWEKYLLGW